MLPLDAPAEAVDVVGAGRGERLEQASGAIRRLPAADELHDEPVVEDDRRVRLVDRDGALACVGGEVGHHEPCERPRDPVARRRRGAVDEHAPVAVDRQRAAVDDRPFATENRVH